MSPEFEANFLPSNWDLVQITAAVSNKQPDFWKPERCFSFTSNLRPAAVARLVMAVNGRGLARRALMSSRSAALSFLADELLID